MLFLIHPNGMGFGDVKLALSLGVVLGWYGWTVLFVGAFAGFLLGSLYGLGLMALRRAGPQDRDPVRAVHDRGRAVRSAARRPRGDGVAPAAHAAAPGVEPAAPAAARR